MNKRREGFLKRVLTAVLALSMVMLTGAGVKTACADGGDEYKVKVDSGYLALRDEESYDASNEIGKLYTGDTVVYICDGNTQDYWYVYSKKLDLKGYVNKKYLTASDGGYSTVYTDDSAIGISRNLRCDMEKMEFSTDYLHFDIPDSWSDGIWMDYDEDEIKFYCKAVKEASGSEDGYLCSIVMSEIGPPEGNVQDISTGNLKYNYYLVTPSDLRANRNDTANYKIYQAMLEDAMNLADKVEIDR